MCGAKPGAVETLRFTDRGLAGDQRAPKLFHADTERRDQTDPGDDDLLRHRASVESEPARGNVPSSIYFINPRSSSPGYFGAEVFERALGVRLTSMADLALPTIAAMLPDSFQFELCDEDIAPADLSTGAEIVAITGKVSQFPRMRELARDYRAQKKTVLIGGPFASLCPEAVRPFCDVLVEGEVEEIFPELIADLAAGRPKDHYRGTRPDLSLSPLPRWDRYPNDHAITGSIQTSRGCPFECEFCDVIQYLGRKQRHKPIPNVLAELDVLYARGYRTIFIADDNLTVVRGRAKALLAELRDWNNRRTAGRVRFRTQVSIDAADDEEILTLARDANLTTVFVGIETSNPESLREAKKRQNLDGDMVERLHRFFDHGILVVGGMIVGFDHDDASIFDRQLGLAQESGVPVLSAGALVAPHATPLHARLQREGRLVPNASEIPAVPWTTNIVPKMMSADVLLEGLGSLCRRLYDPQTFAERLLSSLKRLATGRIDRRPHVSQRATDEAGLALLRTFPRLGPEESKAFRAIVRFAGEHPHVGPDAAEMMINYLQIRHMYDRAGLW